MLDEMMDVQVGDAAAEESVANASNLGWGSESLGFPTIVHNNTADLSITMTLQGNDDTRLANDTLMVDVTGVAQEDWTPEQLSMEFAIIVNATKFKVHKGAAASQCIKIGELLAMNPEMESVVIEGFTEETVEGLVRFFYSDEINIDTDFFELFTLAEAIEFSDLAEKCAELMVATIDEKNAFEIFSTGHKYNSRIIIEGAFKELNKLVPNNPLKAELMDEPEKLQKVIEVARKREQKIKEFEEECQRKRAKLEEELGRELMAESDDGDDNDDKI